MQVARAWTTLACRPCRRLVRRFSLPFIHQKERYCRHVFQLPRLETPGQEQNDSHDASNKSRSKQWLSVQRKSYPSKPARRLSKFVDEEVIDSHSLSATLQAHRDANESNPTIRRVNRSPDPLYSNNPKPKAKVSGTSISLELFRNGNYEKREQEREDYQGEVRALDMGWAIIGEVPRTLRLPWMSVLDAAGPSQERAQDRLSAEIRAADQFFTPASEEVKSTLDAHEEIESYLTARFRDLKLDLIGSRASGLAMPLSDLDFNIRYSCTYSKTPLYEIWSKMRYEHRPNKIIESSYAAFTARVPILVGIHIKTGLEVQFQHADAAYGSLETVKGLLAEHSNLRPLFKVLKHMLKIRGLCHGKGRITSYPLLNMIAVVLKLNPQECLPRHLGLNLLKFLDFWTDAVDFYSTGITHTPSPYAPVQFGPFDTTEAYFSDEKTALDTIGMVLHDPVGAKPAFFNVQRDLHEIHRGRNDYRMVLHDPANPYNDLGSGAYQIKHLQATLIDIRRKVKSDMAEWDRTIRAHGGMATPSLSLLRHFLEGDYTLYNIERKRLLPHDLID